MHAIIDAITKFPPTIATLLLAMMPIGELRAAIPVAITVFHYPIWLAFLLGFVGNMISIVLLLLLLKPVSDFLRRHFAFFEKFFSWLFRETHGKFYNHHKRWGDIALVILVALPLPGAGGWTGSAAAFLFGIKFWKAFSLSVIGTLISATVVTLLTVGIKYFF